MTTLVVGLALALAVGVGVKASSDDCSGGYFCGYGDCWIHFYWCEGGSCSYQNTGGGGCVVTLQNPPGGCEVDYACDGGAFGWTGLAQYEWQTELLIQD